MPLSSLSTSSAAAVLRLLQRTVRANPPAQRANRPMPRPDAALGMYLHALGYLEPHQLVQALAAQQSVGGQPLRPVGDLMVERAGLAPEVLASVLVYQTANRLVLGLPVRFLGEQLLATAQISPEQLATALQTQAWLRRMGQQVPFGELVVQQGMVARAERDRALRLLGLPRER